MVLDSQAVALIVSLGEGGMYFVVSCGLRSLKKGWARSLNYRQQNQFVDSFTGTGRIERCKYEGCELAKEGKTIQGKRS